MRLAGLIARAREYLERALEDARAQHDRELERTIGRRLVELAVHDELNEAMERVKHGRRPIVALPSMTERHAATRRRRR